MFLYPILLVMGVDLLQFLGIWWATLIGLLKINLLFKCDVKLFVFQIQLTDDLKFQHFSRGGGGGSCLKLKSNAAL